MKRCLIYLDLENIQNSIDLLEVANQIYGETAFETYGVALNQSCPEAEGQFDWFFRVEDDKVDYFDIISLTHLIQQLHQTHAFDSILIPATHLGRMLAPRLAMRLHVGLVADVTAINHREGVLEMVRPAFSGKIMAGIVNKGQVPVMMSVRQNVFNYHQQGVKNTQIIDYKPEHITKGNMVLLETRFKEKSKDIRDSEILVSGGGGTREHFEDLNRLADALDAQVSASRKIIDDGIAPRSIQVGQSGKTVSPKLYMALGIYGSLQHIEGLKNVEYIISVNTNKDAPICSLSDIVVEGDVKEFIEKLVARIGKNKSAQL